MRGRGHLGPQRAPQHERDPRPAGAEPGGRKRRAPGGAGHDGAVAAGRGEGVHLALGHVPVRDAGILDAAGGVVRAAAEQRELEPDALVQRRERARRGPGARGS